MPLHVFYDGKEVTRLLGLTSGNVLEVTNNNEMYQQPRSRRAQMTCGTVQSFAAGGTYVLENTIHFVNPLLTIKASTTSTFTIQAIIGAVTYTFGQIDHTAGQASYCLTDKASKQLATWTFGTLRIYSSAAQTDMYATISHLP